jgi:phosphatidylethanolamine-binding protein (PEBP) family uncharacterized protein
MRAILTAGLFTLAFSAAAQAMGLSVDWTGTKPCFDAESPVIGLQAVPKGTTKLHFHMTDLDAPTYPHGGGDVSYKGQSHLPKGAFHYKGPCPPAVHRYAWSVEALDAAGRVIDTAKVVVRFPPQ